MLLDAALSFQPAVRMLYLFPTVLAARREGLIAARIAAVATMAVAILLDYSRGALSPMAAFADAALYLAILNGVAYYVVRVECGIQTFAQLATRDPLTGLLNRYALFELGEEAVDEARRSGKPLVVAMLDCDKFKELNDLYGHAYGDQVLQHLARCLKRALPNSALIARTGGDEFAIILTGKFIDQAHRHLERAAQYFSEGMSTSGISFGLARLGMHGRTLSELLAAADRNMYLSRGSRIENAVVAGVA